MEQTVEHSDSASSTWNYSNADEVNVQEPSAKKPKPSNAKSNEKPSGISAEVLKLMTDIYKDRKDARTVDDYGIIGEFVARKLRNLKSTHFRR